MWHMGQCVLWVLVTAHVECCVSAWRGWKKLAWAVTVGKKICVGVVVVAVASVRVGAGGIGHQVVEVGGMYIQEERTLAGRARQRLTQCAIAVAS